MRFHTALLRRSASSVLFSNLGLSVNTALNPAPAEDRLSLLDGKLFDVVWYLYKIDLAALHGHFIR